MNIFEEVKKLQLPIGKYVVVGSGPMAARGIKEPNDVDIVVTPDLFMKCKESGEWEIVPWTKEDHQDQVYLKKEPVELYLDVNYGDFWPTTKELLDNSEIIEGVPFINLEYVLKFKRAYGREKDFKDIALIEEYLKRKAS